MADNFSYVNGIMLYKGENIGISRELIQDMSAALYRGGQEYMDLVEDELERKYQKMFGWKIREKKIEEILG